MLAMGNDLEDDLVSVASSSAASETVLLAAIAIGTWILFAYFNREDADPDTVSSLSKEGGSNREWSSRGFIAEMKRQGRSVIVFYGSQTGTAKEFATRLTKEAARFGLKAMLADPEECEMEEMIELTSMPNHLAIFCLATHGEGDPTDNCQEFYQWLQDTPCSLPELNYAVFGLGNKTYEHYNAMARYVDKRLKELGARQIFPLGEGDDDANIEEDFITWKDAFWASICDTFQIEQSTIDFNMRQYRLILHDKDSLSEEEIFKGEITKLKTFKNQRPPYGPKNPCLAEVVEKRELYSGERSCLHIEFDIQNPGLRYETGDHMALYPSNDSNIVDKLGELLDANLDRIFTLRNADVHSPQRNPFPCPTSYRTALTNYVDVCAPPRTHILGELAEFCKDENDKTKLKLMSSTTAEGKAAYKTWILENRRSIVHILEDLPSCKPPLDLLLEFLPRLQPRFYSISSSSMVHPGRLHITAVTVAYRTPTGRQVWGVATGQYTRTPVGTKLPIFVRRSRFKLPPRSTVPIIMVGPGTGVAPFRAFLQERHHQRTQRKKEIGESHLFFGCRRSDQDFLYREEFETYVAEGTCKLYTAFSREQNVKVYVTHLLKERMDLIWEILGKQNGHFYVCGDGRTMARDVHEIVMTALQEKGNMTFTEAKKYFKMMESQRRYSTDVWG